MKITDVDGGEDRTDLFDPLARAPYGTVLETWDKAGTVLFRGSKTTYRVVPSAGVCTCKDWEYRGGPGHDCKHLLAVREHLLMGPRTCPVCRGLGQQHRRGRVYECEACQGVGQVPVEEVEAWIEARDGMLPDERQEQPILTDEEMRRLFA